MLVNCYASAVPETSGERWIQRVAVEKGLGGFLHRGHVWWGEGEWSKRRWTAGVSTWWALLLDTVVLKSSGNFRKIKINPP